MTVQEIYDFILKHMTAEEALMNLLIGHVRTYDSLKFNEGEEIHPVMLVTTVALDMGWDMAIPDSGEDEDILGMIIGTPDYVKECLDDEERLDEALELLQYFVDRVEAGTIRSQTTYKKYKDFLNRLNED